MPSLGSLADRAYVLDTVQDPVLFARRVLGMDPWSKQTAILAALRDHRRVVVPSCNAGGKTEIAAVAALHHVTAHPDGIVITTAPTWTQVEKLLWGAIHRRVAQARITYPPLNQTELRMGPGNYALGLSTNEGVRFQGWHGRILIVLDEAPGVSPEIWDSIRGISAGGDVRVLAIGNPLEPSGPFYDACHGAGSQWHRIEISAFDTPNLAGLSIEDVLAMDEDALAADPRPYLAGRRFVRDAYLELGPDSPLYISRVLGQFPTETLGALIPLSWLSAARTRAPGDFAGEPVHVGVDVAGPGEDETVVYVVQGMNVLHHQSWTIPDPRAAVAECLAPWRDRIGRVSVDSAGIGHYFARHLQDAGYPVLDVNVGVGFAPKSRDRLKYRLLKDKLYWELRQRFQAGDVCGLTDDRTIAQLASLRYEQPRGLVQIESKEDARKRGIKSPDRAEALMLAFSDPPRPGFLALYEQMAGALDQEDPGTTDPTAYLGVAS